MDIQEIKNRICDEIFSDTYSNVENLLDKVVSVYSSGLMERKAEYKDLATIYSALKSNDMSVLNTLKKYKGQDMQGVLYDAYKDALNATFNEIKESCYKFNESDIDENLTKQVGDDVKVYNIKKNSQKLLINSSRMLRETKESDYKTRESLDAFINPRLGRKINKDYKSLSYVDNKDLKVYRDVKEYVTFVYPTDIPNDMLITISRQDAWTDFKDKDVHVENPSFLGKAESLLGSTNEYNEISVLREAPIRNEQIKPIALFCSKKITDYEKQIAKILNIPIVYSESEYKPKFYKKANLPYNNLKEYKNYVANATCK